MAACARAGRDPAEVALMAVTKTHPADLVAMAGRAGLQLFGENRVQEAATKRAAIGVPGRWELIGHLQSNKARLALETFERIQSVDRPKLVRVLARLIGEGHAAKPYPVLLQVNAGEDPAKYGCAVEQAEGLLELAVQTGVLQVDGLMTIAPWSDDPEVARRCFVRLRELRDRLASRSGLGLNVLSMGMTGDFETAIEEGSTLVRVGSGLFGQRD